MAKNKKNKPASQPIANRRKLKLSKYKPAKVPKLSKEQAYTLPSSWQLLKRTNKILWQHKKTLGGVLLIYGLVQIMLVQGALSSNFSELKDTLDDSVGGVSSSVAVLSYMFGSLGQTNSSEANIYQFMLFVIGSLAFIWALRQLMADSKIRIRDAYYKGMYPLIPFMLVLVVIVLQTIPALIGAWLYGAAAGSGMAVSAFEHVFWFIIFFMFALLSFYMMCSSLFALYIVTLPDMAPLKALRSARGLVIHRRWSVVRKLFILAVTLLISVAIVMMPIIIIVPALAAVSFYTLTVLVVGAAHVYVYSLYRELLNDG